MKLIYIELFLMLKIDIFKGLFYIMISEATMTYSDCIIFDSYFKFIARFSERLLERQLKICPVSLL